MKNSSNLISTPNETTDTGSHPVFGAKPEDCRTVVPRQRLQCTANPDLQHLVSRDGYFRTWRRVFAAETNAQETSAEPGGKYNRNID